MKDERIGDAGTFEKPDQPAIGTHALLVNGLSVAAKGEPITSAELADQPGARQTF